MKDDIRPKGTVQVPCSGKGCAYPDGGTWHFWVDALDPSLPDGPFLCFTCKKIDSIEKATGCTVKRIDTQHDGSDGLPAGTRHLYVFEDTNLPVELFKGR